MSFYTQELTRIANGQTNIQTSMRHSFAALEIFRGRREQASAQSPDADWIDAGYNIDAPGMVPAGNLYTVETDAGRVCTWPRTIDRE